MLKLYIGNKNYSSWSMRPWVLMREKGIAFDEVLLRFDYDQPDSTFKRRILPLNPTGTVPVLVDGELQVHDSLAICEYLAECFPEKDLWPKDRALRARARSACAEMHAGFGGLRQYCSMNIEARLHEQGRIILRDQPRVRAELERLANLWRGLLDASGGPLLGGGSFGIVDAYYAPVACRVVTYGLPLPAEARAYVERVLAVPGVKAWIDAALQEADFVPFDEPYRASRDGQARGG